MSNGNKGINGIHKNKDKEAVNGNGVSSMDMSDASVETPLALPCLAREGAGQLHLLGEAARMRPGKEEGFRVQLEVRRRLGVAYLKVWHLRVVDSELPGVGVDLSDPRGIVLFRKRDLGWCVCREAKDATVYDACFCFPQEYQRPQA